MDMIVNDTRHFLVINTTEYNEDGKYCVQDAVLDDLEGLGFEIDEISNTIELLSVGDVAHIDKGVLIIRVS